MKTRTARPKIWLSLSPGAVLLWFLFFLIQFSASADVVDSLKGVLKNNLPDTQRIKVLAKISYELSYSDPEKGVEYGLQAKKLAENIRWQKGLGLACNNIGVNYMVLAESEKALQFLNQALKADQEAGEKLQTAQCLGNIGMVYIDKSAYSRALEYLFKSLKVFEEIDNKLGIGNQLGAIGNVFKKQHDFPKALHYDSLALEIFKKTGDKEGVAIQLGNMGNAYEAMHKFDKALVYNRQALQLYTELNNAGGMARNLMNIGVLYNDKGMYKMALKNILEAYDIYKQLDDLNGQANCLGNAGQAYLLSEKNHTNRAANDTNLIPGSKAEKINKAIGYFKEAYEITDATGDLGLKSFLAKQISDAFVLQGNFAEAHKFLEKYVELNDSIFTMESNIKIENLTTERELMVKDKQIEIDRLAVEKKRNERVFFMIGIALLLIISGFVYRSYIKQKKLNHAIEIEKSKSENLLLNILPAEIAEELKESGSAAARHFDSVSVLFTDFKDFTQTSEKMSAAELVGEIDYIYSEFDRIIEKYNVEKIKTIGDSYMAAGGLPKASATHAVDTVNAALDLRDFIIETGKKREQQGKPFFHIRIGIHTGPVVAGIVGIKKFAYDIWGDTVNLASRMESSGEKGMVNISADTYELVKDHFVCTYRGKVNAKHKGEIDMYFVERKS